jgi:uncharacterized membrane protein YedE/YeeE
MTCSKSNQISKLSNLVEEERHHPMKEQNQPRSVGTILTRLTLIPALWIGLVLGVVVGVAGSVLVGILSSWLISGSRLWIYIATNTLMRGCTFVLGLFLFGIGLIALAPRDLWIRIEHEGFAARPHIKALIASTVVGFGVGIIYCSAFLQH